MTVCLTKWQLIRKPIFHCSTVELDGKVEIAQARSDVTRSDAPPAAGFAWTCAAAWCSARGCLWAALHAACFWCAALAVLSFCPCTMVHTHHERPLVTSAQQRRQPRVQFCRHLCSAQVHSECAESAYINSRPFRVNAGPVTLLCTPHQIVQLLRQWEGLHRVCVVQWGRSVVLSDRPPCV